MEPRGVGVAGPSATAVAAAVVAAESTQADGRGSRRSPVMLAVGVMAVIAVVAALYLARAFFIPLLLGILASYALSPVVDAMKPSRIPRSLAAALVLALIVGALAWLSFSLSDGVTAMTEKLPEAAQKLRASLRAARDGGPTALQNVQEAADELQGAARDAGSTGRGRVVSPTRAQEHSSWLRDYALAQSGLLLEVVAQAPIVLLLTYFLLASGVHFRRKLVQWVGPSLTRKKDAVRILDEVHTQVQRYLLAMLLSHVLVGVLTWLALEALGMEQAGVWGLAAGIAHFVPYLGPATVAVASGIGGFLQFGSLLGGLAAGGATLLVAGTIGMVIMTWLQSRFASLNPAVLFIALLFFGWLWGAWGLLLGAPLVAVLKVICDRVEGLKPAGELLGR
jgi:predicted PurR-regulated permease PerM